MVVTAGMPHAMKGKCSIICDGLFTAVHAVRCWYIVRSDLTPGARPKSQRERTLPPSLFRHEETKKWHFYFKWFSLGTFSGEIWLTYFYMQPIGPLHWKQQRGKGCMWLGFEDRQSRCKAIVTRNSTFIIWLMRWVILPTPILQPSTTYIFYFSACKQTIPPYVRDLRTSHYSLHSER